MFWEKASDATHAKTETAKTKRGMKNLGDGMAKSPGVRIRLARGRVESESACRVGCRIEHKSWLEFRGRKVRGREWGICARLLTTVREIVAGDGCYFLGGNCGRGSGGSTKSLVHAGRRGESRDDGVRETTGFSG